MLAVEWQPPDSVVVVGTLERLAATALEYLERATCCSEVHLDRQANEREACQRKVAEDQHWLVAVEKPTFVVVVVVGEEEHRRRHSSSVVQLASDFDHHLPLASSSVAFASSVAVEMVDIVVEVASVVVVGVAVVVVVRLQHQADDRASDCWRWAETKREEEASTRLAAAAAETD